MKEKITKALKRGVVWLCTKIKQMDVRMKRLILFSIVMIAAGGLVGGKLVSVNMGKKMEEQKQKADKKFEKETKKLEEQLKKARRENVEERPWYLMLVNDTNPMPEGYVPELVNFDAERQVDARILEPLQQMIGDMQKEGLSPFVCSAYRSVDRQKELYNEYMTTAVQSGMNYWQAFEDTATYTAYPGKSEHGIGLAVDIISNNYTELDEQQEQTPEAQWLAANCHKYGFILRYPSEKTGVTGIIYEPWHYRYVGVEDATKIYETGVTLEEYLGEAK